LQRNLIQIGCSNGELLYPDATRGGCLNILND
jgi:hypothetical protein